MELIKPIHEKVLNVAWGDMDALGHVNHGRYFEYFQEVRIEWMRELNLTFKAPTGPVIIHTECTFKAPIIYPAKIVIKSYIKNIGTTSLLLEHKIFQNEQIMVYGSCKIVWIDYLKNKAVPLPEVIRDQFVAS